MTTASAAMPPLPPTTITTARTTTEAAPPETRPDVSLHKSLRNARDSNENLRRRRGSAKTAKTLSREPSVKSTRGQSFRVGNVTSNGRMYLRPSGPPPPPPLTSAPLTPPDSPPADTQAYSEEPWRESFVTHSDASRVVQVVVNTNISSRKNSLPFLETHIPHFRIGRPRFTDHGSALLTDSFITGDSSGTASRVSPVYTLHDYAVMFPAPPQTPDSPEFRPRTASSASDAVRGPSRSGSAANNLIRQESSETLSATPALQPSRSTPGIKRVFGSLRRAISARRGTTRQLSSGPVSAWRGPVGLKGPFSWSLSRPLHHCNDLLNCVCLRHEGDPLNEPQQPSRSVPATPRNELETSTPNPIPQMQQIRTSRSAPILNLKHLQPEQSQQPRVASNVTVGSHSIVIVNDTGDNTPTTAPPDDWLAPPSVHADSISRNSQASEGSRIVPLFLEPGASAESQIKHGLVPPALRRRPGGDLKSAQNIQELQEHDRQLPSSPLSTGASLPVPERSSSVMPRTPQTQQSFYLTEDASSEADTLSRQTFLLPEDPVSRGTFLIPSRSSSILRTSLHTDPQTQSIFDMDEYEEPPRNPSAVPAALRIVRSKSPLVPSRTSSVNATQAEPAAVLPKSSAPSAATNNRGTYEAELARLAELPDDDIDDGGIEATLRRLEGRYRVSSSSDSAMGEDDDGGNDGEDYASSTRISKARDEAAALLTGVHTAEAVVVPHPFSPDRARQSVQIRARQSRRQNPLPVPTHSDEVRPTVSRGSSFNLHNRSASTNAPSMVSFSLRDRPPTAYSHKRSEPSVSGSAPSTPTIPRYPASAIPRYQPHIRAGSDARSSSSKAKSVRSFHSSAKPVWERFEH